MRIRKVLPLVVAGWTTAFGLVASGQTQPPLGTLPAPGVPPVVAQPPGVPPAPPPIEGVQAPATPPIGPPTRAMVCNDLAQPFGLAVDGQRFETVTPGGCRMARLSAGTHLFSPKGRADVGPFFAHPAWQVDVPVEGAVLRFGIAPGSQVANLLEVLRGLPAGQPQATPEEQPIYVGQANEFGPQETVPLSPWQVCAPPGSPLSVMVDGYPAFSLLGGACGAAYLPYGYHTFSYLNPMGGYFCPPYVGHAGPRGGHIGATPGGVRPVRPRWRGFPVRNSVRVDTGRVRTLVPQPRTSMRPLGHAEARQARRVAFRAAVAARRLGYGVTRNRQPWPSHGRAWAQHRRNNSGWVVGPTGRQVYRGRTSPGRRWVQRPRAWRQPPRSTYSNGAWRTRPGTMRPGRGWGGPARVYRGYRGGGVRPSVSPPSTRSRGSYSRPSGGRSGGGRSGGGRR